MKPVGDKLDEIMAYTRKALKERMRPVRDSELQRLGLGRTQGGSFADRLCMGGGGLGVIAEIKRKSPSAGQIADLPDATEQARLYVNAGVQCMSVLTDGPSFGGSLKDLWDVTDFLNDHRRDIPCLRKDFMVHPLQVVEAAEAGARCILVIVRVLTEQELKDLYDAATVAGLDTLFEVHSEAELDHALALKPRLVGVNNRDLQRFVTDLSISEALIPQIPAGVVAVSESGIHHAEDAQRAADCGADALLVGEALMRADDPEALVKAFHETRRASRKS
jgi:indole-3-glycerol phosphate synthase